jgi:hypothetical protein
MSGSPPRWSFGNAPLDETRRFAALARRIASLLLQMEAPSALAAELTASLERAEAGLAALAPRDPRPRVGDASQGGGRPYLDHSRDIGDYNPAFPAYTLRVEGDRALGSVAFPVLYEGPPGLVHGGCLALVFDQIIQHHNCEVGQAGKTVSLEVRYSAPTPLLTDLRFEIERRLDGRRIESTARLFAGDTLCATATLRAVAGDLASLPVFSGRRSP